MPPIPPMLIKPVPSATAASIPAASQLRLVALPDDILVTVLFTLPIPDMLRLAATCRDIHKLTLDPEFWRQLTLRAGLDVDHVSHPAATDAAQQSPGTQQVTAVTKVPNTVEAYRSKLMDAIRTRVPAYNSFHGAWLGPDSHHISPRPDSDAIHGQALGINVWWLDIATTFIIPNGTWHLVLRSKATRYADVDNVTWSIESTPTTPPHASSQPSMGPVQTWSMTVSSDVLSEDNQFAWTLFSASQNSDYPLLLRSDSPFHFATQSPPTSCAIKLYSPTGFSHVCLTFKDTNTQRYKYGWMLDEVAWIRAERWKRFVLETVQQEQQEETPGMVAAISQAVSGVVKRALGL